MKTINKLFGTLLTSIMLLSGCLSAGTSASPTTTVTPTSSPTFVPPSATPLGQPTRVVTLTPRPTLQPEQIQATLDAQLESPVDCANPCYLMIIPGQTSLREAENILASLNLTLEFTLIEGGKKFYTVVCELGEGLSTTVIFTVEDDVIKNLRLYIHPEQQIAGVSRRWLSYSPEGLIRKYGAPSKVEIFYGGAAPNPSYTIDLHFSTHDLIVEYYSYDLGPNQEICPRTDQMDSVRVWIGREPVNPPLDAIPIEQSTSLTIDEFSKLMLGDSKNACFDLNMDIVR